MVLTAHCGVYDEPGKIYLKLVLLQLLQFITLAEEFFVHLSEKLIKYARHKSNLGKL